MKLIGALFIALSVIGLGAAKAGAAVTPASTSCGCSGPTVTPLSADGSGTLYTPSPWINGHNTGTLYIRTLWGSATPKTGSMGIDYPVSVTQSGSHMGLSFYVNGVHYVRMVTYHAGGIPNWYSPTEFKGVPFPYKY